MEKLERAHIQQLQNDYGVIWQDAVNHFESLKHIDNDLGAIAPWDSRPQDRMAVATPQEQEMAHKIRRRLADFGTRLLQAARSSVLLESTDEVLLRRRLRQMSSALFLRKFVYHDSYVISDEDRFHGIQPAEQSEEYCDVASALAIFNESAIEIVHTVELIAPTPENLAGAIVSSQMPGLLKSRPNTAFIMMQINEGIPKLEDIKNTIKTVFRDFGIQAVRADEIEHSGIITQKILDEIATSEFLIADLTGERPSVYYEVGYAHALGKRPILYREKGSPLHFDLLVHNVPEYKNTTELSKLLGERLKALTGREPKN
jgi:hypothetical protein